MEFSMEVFTQDLQCRVLETPFPSIGNYPIFDDVNPGIAQIVTMHPIYVPVQGKSDYAIEKKIENMDVPVVLTENGQIGSGEEDNSTKMDPKIAESFNHPRMIKTEKIVFPKVKAEKRKLFLAPKTGHGKIEQKKPKHSFQIV